MWYYCTYFSNFFPEMCSCKRYEREFVVKCRGELRVSIESNCIGVPYVSHVFYTLRPLRWNYFMNAPNYEFC